MKTLLLFALLLTTTLIGCKVADSSVTPTTPGACKLLTTTDTTYDSSTGSRKVGRSTATYEANDNLIEAISVDSLGNPVSRLTFSGYIGNQYTSCSIINYTSSGPKTYKRTLTFNAGKLVMATSEDSLSGMNFTERFSYDANGFLVLLKGKWNNSSLITLDSLLYKNNASGKPDSIFYYSALGPNYIRLQKIGIQYNNDNDPTQITYYNPNERTLERTEISYSNYRSLDPINNIFSFNSFIYPTDNVTYRLKYIPIIQTTYSTSGCSAPTNLRMTRKSFYNILGTNSAGCISKVRAWDEFYECNGSTRTTPVTILTYGY